MELKKQITRLNLAGEKIKHLCDDIRVTSQREIAGLHAGKPIDPKRIRASVVELKKIIKDPLTMTLNKSSIFMAFQEYAELEATMAIVSGKALPKLDIPETCYFTGICDSFGEIRRQFMLQLIKKNNKAAMELLDRALKLSYLVAEIDAAPSIIPDLKPKKDLVQRCIESMLELAARNSL